MIHAIRGERGKDRGRSVAPVSRRLMSGLCMPVAGLLDTVRTVPDTVAVASSMSVSMPIRRRGRASGSLSGRRPSDMGATKSDLIPGAELDRASRPSADFRREIRVRFGSSHGSYPAFLLTCWFFRVDVARGGRRLLRRFFLGCSQSPLFNGARLEVNTPRA
jgi:hypothetical protein